MHTRLVEYFNTLLLTPETNPTVKIFDMEIADKNKRNKYSISLPFRKYPPFNEVIHG